jgi:ribosomal protein S18
MSTNIKTQEQRKKGPRRRRINWNQSLNSKVSNQPVRIKKSLQYIILLRKFNNSIDYKNITLLRAFITKYGKIRPRRKTRVTVQQQKLIAKSIRKARAFGLLPFTCEVKM